MGTNPFNRAIPASTIPVLAEDGTFNIQWRRYLQSLMPSVGPQAGVASVNGESGAINILPGTNVSVDSAGQNITINAEASTAGFVKLGAPVTVGQMAFFITPDTIASSASAAPNQWLYLLTGASPPQIVTTGTGVPVLAGYPLP